MNRTPMAILLFAKPCFSWFCSLSPFPNFCCTDELNAGKEYKKHFSNMKFYSISGSSFAYRDNLLFSDIKNKITLDYCCGNGEIGIEMAKRGAAQVFGIDISKVAINNANRIAREKKVDDRCVFQVMDAENMKFEDDYFDLIHEYGALRHLETEAAFKELARVLKSGGRVVCTEALRHNPLIHSYSTFGVNF